MAEETARDPDFDWLDYVPPQGVVAAPSVLRDLGLIPERQTAVETGQVSSLLELQFDPWAFVEQVLGWDARFVAGAPGGPDLPGDLVVVLPEQNDRLVPTWAVRELGDCGGWQLLVRVEAPRVAPDARHTLEGWEATPHQRLERLLRETGIAAGLLITQREAKTGELEPEIRLVHAPRGETSGWQSFPVRPMATVAGRPILGGFKLLLDRSRLFTERTERRLPALLHASRLAQDTVSEKLSGQVLGALFELLRGLDAAEPALLRQLAAEAPGYLYEGLLAVLMRLVFILYAEDRDLLPSRRDDDARRIYEAGYSVRGLHARLTEDAALNPDTMDERIGGWGRLVALFRLIHAGHPSGFVRARRGGLFDPARYPFLEGRADAAEAPSVLKLTDGCLLRILDGLLVLKERGQPPERLSYRTLDVEQIGSVYETVMGFEARLATGRCLAVKGAKGLPFFVDLDALATGKGKDRIKQLKEGTGLGLTGARAAAVEAAADVGALAQALAQTVDLRASPGAVPFAAGTPILQPTDERRRSGSHYTPRSLTAPIVEHALAPAFERLGPDATPEQILDLKVCDPAMGSGAFLVEACRAIAGRLAKAWERWPDTKPVIPADEVDDDTLHARRLVAQRCLYGVDKNPRAVELAKLSLWLATLARDHEFTFLDHALKCGDSLVGLDLRQITATHWDRSQDPTFVGRMVREHLVEAEAGREDVRRLAEAATEAELAPLLRRSESKLALARSIGDGVIAAFFSAAKPKARIKSLVEFQKMVLAGDWTALSATPSLGERPISPFHWPVEFPEVFSRANPGFDGIIGNPPFLGGKRIAGEVGNSYLDWLVDGVPRASKNADLVAFFFLRAFRLINDGACIGFLATNTIGQGDTRETGLRNLLEHGAIITRAIRRIPWPGEASVVVSSIVLTNNRAYSGNVQLDGRTVDRVSAYLAPGFYDQSPTPLVSNSGISFHGMVVGSPGFTFDDAGAKKGEASFLSEMEHLLRSEPQAREVIFPLIGGDEVNYDPQHRAGRFVINFGERTEGQCRAGWPQTMHLLDRTVRPQLTKVKPGSDWSVSRARTWWLHPRRARGLYRRAALLDTVYALSLVSTHLSLAELPSQQVFSHKLCVFAVQGTHWFAMLQSRAHEIWARYFSSTLGDALNYSHTDCFETFSFPGGFKTSAVLGALGQRYYDYRATLMVARNEGMTKTYNRFHDRSETAADIVRLRELHAEMDRAVLETYGWRDLAERAASIFLDEGNEDDQTYQGRLFWPSDLRDDLLARLLDLNRDRAEEEASLGLTTAASEEEAGVGEDGPEEHW